MGTVGYVWFRYFVPSLWGNGPEAIVQTVGYAVIGALLMPPVRRWLSRVKDEIKDHVSGENAALHAKLDMAHEKMDHIIRYHPDIPDFHSATKVFDVTTELGVERIVKERRGPVRDARGRFVREVVE